MIDWTEFTRVIFIKSDMKTIYNAWAIPDQIEKWFLESANVNRGTEKVQLVPVETNDKYVWRWHCWEHIQEGVILSANGKDQLSFTFGDRAGKCEVKIEEIGNDFCKLSIRQYDIEDTEQGRLNYFTSCQLGWSFWMVNLKAYLEHGICLNETTLPVGFESIHNLVNT